MKWLFKGNTYGATVFCKRGPDGHLYLLLRPPAGNKVGGATAGLYRHRVGVNDDKPELIKMLEGVKRGDGAFDFLPDGSAIVYCGYRQGDSYGYGYEIVSGVVPPFNPSNPTPTPVPTPSPTPAVDETARQLANEAKSLANAARTTAGQAFDRAQAAQRAADAKPSHGDVADIAWGKAGDRIYNELQNVHSPLMASIWQKALDATYSFCRERGLIK